MPTGELKGRVSSLVTVFDSPEEACSWVTCRASKHVWAGFRRQPCSISETAVNKLNFLPRSGKFFGKGPAAANIRKPVAADHNASARRAINCLRIRTDERSDESPAGWEVACRARTTGQPGGASQDGQPVLYVHGAALSLALEQDSARRVPCRVFRWCTWRNTGDCEGGKWRKFLGRASKCHRCVQKQRS